MKYFSEKNMNLKTLFKHSVLLFMLMVLLSGLSFASQTYFVNNQIGNDGRNGLSATIPSPDDFVTGPKRTIGGAAGALIAANTGDFIVVSYTGTDYTTATGEPTVITVTKAVTFQSIIGTSLLSPGLGANTPTVTSTVDFQPGAGNNVTFNNGTFKLTGSIILTSGNVLNSSSLITVAGTVYRGQATATVTGQLLYSGTVNFAYVTTGTTNITTGDEFPVTGTSIGNITVNTSGTTASFLFKAGSTPTITGKLSIGTGFTIPSTTPVVIAAANTVADLNANTVTLNNTAASDPQHILPSGSTIQNGTLSFTLLSNVSLSNAAGVLPLTSSGGTLLLANTALVVDAATAYTFYADAVASGSVTAKNLASVILNAVASTGAITNSGNGVLNITTVNTTALTINGDVTLNGSALTAASGNGQILVSDNSGGATLLRIKGSVVNSASFGAVAGALANIGIISFANRPVTIDNNVTLSGTISGAVTGTTAMTTCAEIRFLQTLTNSTDITIGGYVKNSGKLTTTGVTALSSIATSLRIVFSATTANVVVTGGFQNYAQIAKAAAAGFTNGNILFTGRTSGTIGTSSSLTGDVINMSTVGDATIEGTAGSIDFGQANTVVGTFYGKNIRNGDGTVGIGGCIYFSGANVINITGDISSNRTATGADIIAAVGAAAVTHIIGGNIWNYGKSNITLDLTGDAITITGKIQNDGTGTISFPNVVAGVIFVGQGIVSTNGVISVPATHTGAVNFNNSTFDVRGGEVDLLGTGASITNINNLNWISGTLKFTGIVSIAANGTNHVIGNASGVPAFTADATTIITINTPSSSTTQTVTTSVNEIVWPGGLVFNNTTGLVPALNWIGGNFRIAGNLTITTGIIAFSGATLYLTGPTAAFTISANGYTTTNQARISMNGASAGTQTVVAAAGTYFGDFEVYNLGTAVSFAGCNATSAFKGTFYLTLGSATGAGNIHFNNITVYPTLVRNAGTFDATPDYISNVNITYIGYDKASSFELPAIGGGYDTKVQDLTVATSNGNVSGKGSVQIGVSAQINRTITVNANQALVIKAGFTLVMAGATINLNGDIANIDNTGLLKLAATAGTTITGAGYLPFIYVAANSKGNAINGATALVDGLLGTDGIRGGAGTDYVVASNPANGDIWFLGDVANLSLNMGTGIPFDGSHLGELLTVAGTTDLTLTLNKNLIGSDILDHEGGLINLNGFTYEVRGAANILNGAAPKATFSSTGLLKFGTGAVSLKVINATDAIASNVEIANASTFTLILAGGGQPLTIAGNLQVDAAATLTLNAALTLTGKNFTIQNTGALAGTGLLTLNATAPNAPLLFTYNGSPSIANLTISNDVSLQGTSNTGFTVTAVFTHTAGNINFGSRTLIFQGSFVRNSLASMSPSTGQYIASTTPGSLGYMVFNGTMTVDQSVDGFTIPNLRFSSATPATAAATLTPTSGVITVTNNLDVMLADNNGATKVTITDLVIPTPRLSVSDGAIVNWSKGGFDIAPKYLGAISFVATAYLTGSTINNTVWPATLPSVTNLTIAGTLSTDAVILPASKTVTNALTLAMGVFTIGPNTFSLSSGGYIYRNNVASIDATTSGAVVNLPVLYTLTYNTTKAAGATPTGNITSGVELGPQLAKLIVTRSVDVSNAVTTLGSSFTATDSIIIRNNTVVASGVQVTAKGNIVVKSDNPPFVNATTPTLTFADATTGLVVAGASGQKIQVPATFSVPNLTVNMPLTPAFPVVNLVGGSLTITNELFFLNGIIVVDTTTHMVNLPRPNGATNSGLGYDRSAVEMDTTRVGHIVGNVARPGQLNDGTAGDGRFVFPVGALPIPLNDGTGRTKAAYRPITITFTPSYPLGSPTTLVVRNVDSTAGGSVGFPAVGGNGVLIGKTAPYYWSVYSTPSGLSQTQIYDVEMQGTNLRSPYSTFLNLRGIRRLGNSILTNWYALSTADDGTNNAQVVNTTYNDTTVWVRTTASQGGITNAPSVFTIGLPISAPAFAADLQGYTRTVKEMKPLTIPLVVASSLAGTVPPVVTILSSTPATNGTISANTTPGTNTYTGSFNWTPGWGAAEGTGPVYTVVFQAKDNSISDPTLQTTTVTYTITVLDSLQAVVITPNAGNTASPTINYVPAPVTWSYSACNPDGVSIVWSAVLRNHTTLATVYTLPGLTSSAIPSVYSPAWTFVVDDINQAYDLVVTAAYNSTTYTNTIVLNKVAFDKKYGNIDGIDAGGVPFGGAGQANALDATYALRMAVGFPYFDPSATVLVPFQLINFALGDVTRGSSTTTGYRTSPKGTVFSVGAYDAYLILVRAGGNMTAFPIENTAYPKEVACQGTLAMSSPLSKTAANSNVVSVPLTIANGSNVNAITYNLTYDQKVADVAGVTNNLPKDWITTFNAANGQITIVMAGVTPISAAALVDVNFTLKNKDAKFNLTGSASINNKESIALATMTVGLVPANFELSQNYPNPFNPSTVIKYSVAKSTPVKLSIYNIEGQLVRTLVNETQEAGFYQVTFDGRNSFGQSLASGMYIYRIDAGDFVATKKLMLMK